LNIKKDWIAFRLSFAQAVSGFLGQSRKKHLTSRKKIAKIKPVAMKPVSETPPPTIREVAKQASVSPGTVSRVLNNSPLVSESTRQRVLQVVEELDYHPNLMAQRLSIGKTLRIAAIVPFFTRPAEAERLRGVVGALSESQYDLVIYNVETPEQRDQYFRQVPLKERVDGVIVISLPPTEEAVERLSEAKVPLVFIDVQHPGLSNFDRISGDDRNGGRMATRYLISLGHRNIAFIGDEPDSDFHFTSSHDRLQGFQDALEEAGISSQPNYIAQDKPDRYAARQQAEHILESGDRPTAIFAASDTQAMGVLAAARNTGIFVPDELSVIGYDDIEISEYLGLTTIRQQLYETGQLGVELLLNRILNPNLEVAEHQIQAELLIRETTKPLHKSESQN
jgi:LacI family transcriptional regulator